MKPLAIALLFAAALPLTAAAQQPPERKDVPDDSVEIVTTGCLKGRMFTATVPPEESMRRGPNVAGRNFRLSGPREVMDEVKRHDGHLVQVVGIVRKSALADYTPGARVGNTRVVIGMPRTGNPMGSPGRPPVSDAPAVMDTTWIRYISDTCPIPRR
ncbi:MAG TPA: hypothetical protein VIL35_00520 [Vicinamibacterales bacterium]